MKFAVAGAVGLATLSDAQMGFFPPRGLYGFNNYMGPNAGAYNFNNNFQALSSPFQNFVNAQNFGNGMPNPSIHTPSTSPFPQGMGVPPQMLGGNFQQQFQQQQSPGMPLSAYGMNTRFNYGPWGFGSRQQQQFGGFNQFPQADQSSQVSASFPGQFNGFNGQFPGSAPGFGYRPTGQGPSGFPGNNMQFPGNAQLPPAQPTAVPATEAPATEAPATEAPAQEDPSEAPDTPAAAMPNLAEAIAGSPSHTTLATIVTDEKYIDILNAITGEDKFTIFAPTDAAFDKVALTKETYTQAPVDTISYVLLHHAVPGAILAGDLAEGDNVVTTAAGTQLTVKKEGASVCVMNGDTQSCVTTADVMASNGVVHVVDEVLRPPSPTEEETTPKKKKKKTSA